MRSSQLYNQLITYLNIKYLQQLLNRLQRFHLQLTSISIATARVLSCQQLYSRLLIRSYQVKYWHLRIRLFWPLIIQLLHGYSYSASSSQLRILVRRRVHALVLISIPPGVSIGIYQLLATIRTYMQYIYELTIQLYRLSLYKIQYAYIILSVPAVTFTRRHTQIQKQQIIYMKHFMITKL